MSALKGAAAAVGTREAHRHPKAMAGEGAQGYLGDGKKNDKPKRRQKHMITKHLTYENQEERKNMESAETGKRGDGKHGTSRKT